MASYRATSIYGNRSQTTRNNSGTWVYYNGELYHAGVKGMRWGFHLPGTDYWKDLGNRAFNKVSQTDLYKKARNTELGKVSNHLYDNSQRLYGRQIGRGEAIARAGVQLTKDKVRTVNNKAKTNASFYAKQQYDLNQRNFNNLRGSTYLNSISSKLMDSGASYANNMLGKNSKWKDIINLAIRNTGFNIVNGINNFLVKKGWDKKVDAFIKKVIDTSTKAYNTVKTTATNAYNSAHSTANNVINKIRRNNK